MQEAIPPANEKERLKELESFSILDTLSEAEYDDITAIAAEICGTEISLISLIDEKRQWFKSHFGLAAVETPREYAFCAHAINDQENVFIVQDARRDERFHDNPLVTDDPHVIFYAGVPLVSDNGLPLGTLCVIDHKPKLLSQRQINSLTALGRQVMHVLNLRKTKITLENTLTKLEEKNQELEDFAFVAAHDLKSPLLNISAMSEMLTETYAPQLGEQGEEMLRLVTSSSKNLKELIDGLLEYSRCDNALEKDIAPINLVKLKEDISGLFSYEQSFNMKLNTELTEVMVSQTAIQQILLNLVANAIKYNDKENIEIEIGVSSNGRQYELYVQDNGPGIAEEYQEKIFQIFTVLTSTDRFGTQGNGIGLATVKKMVEGCGGSIHVESEVSKGAKFVFTMAIPV